ncbi:bile acid:sodium symporter family protein [Chitinolyticbacter meiyuanensis]|uniref:bile acid:sodium symporter family protein n=1 Tax=Chitinolyticbacter meiyuanensis TaxID=682798 RepID=UPI0011E59BFD|nr:bile acid:sodium symporter family protein [Chitinolyticbacter meiyuanensis]
MKKPPFSLDGFLLAMLAAVALALVWPGIGTSNGPLHLGVITTWGVALVFFLHGAALSPQSLKAGVTNWRLHLFVQTSTYLLFPLLGGLLVWAGHGHIPADVLLGVFFLCALPSTISSSVAMTTMGKGNVAGAVFNASLSSLIGMVATPLLIGLMISTSGHAMPLGEAIRDIALQLLLPFTLGQALRPWLGGWLARHKPVVNKVDRAVIVLIVYTSFCDSTAAGLWHDYAWWMLASILGVAALLLASVLGITIAASRALGFSRADEVAAVFCGSKKSLAAGIPMARLLFAGHPALGLIVLPVMCYHQLQLLVCTVLARRYAARAEP